MRASFWTAYLEKIMLLVFTDLDGTLLNSDDYRYDDAIPAINHLQAQNIPIVPVTSKTRTEVEAIRRSIPLHAPFITENGSGIFIPIHDERFSLTEGISSDCYRVAQLGCNYSEVRQGLKELSLALGIELKGFGDMSAQDVVILTGLSFEEAKLAKQRDFTEPFITPQSTTIEALQQEAHKLGFKLVVGDRFTHLIDKNAGKGTAVARLINAYQNSFPQEKITSIGLGNSPNDLGMLLTVDIPIVIPGKGEPHPEMTKYDWAIAQFPGARGWRNAITQIKDLTQGHPKNQAK